MGESKIYRYTGKEAVVTWDQGVCYHAQECVRGLPRVFDPKAKPWVNPDTADVEALKTTIARCPSGALKLYAPDGTLLVASGPGASKSTTVNLRANGPYIFVGDIVLAGPAPKSEVQVALCRCGQSKNKPYCVGTHYKVGFQAPGTLPADAAPGAAAPGRVTVTPTENGPLHCTGPLTLSGVDSRTTACSETWLCRCGGSQTKPYCDGTHKKNGFRS